MRSVWLVLVICATSALRAEPIAVPPGPVNIDLGTKVRYALLAACPDRARLAEIPLQRQADEGAPSLGLTTACFVGRLRFHNLGPARDFLLSAGTTRVGHVEMIAPDASGQVAGTRYPYYARPIVSSSPTFALTLPPGPTTIYLLAYSEGSMAMPVSLLDRNSFANREDRYNIVGGGFLFALSVMGLYNLGIFFLTRARGHFFYAAYALSGALLFASQAGYLHRFVWPDRPDLEVWSGIGTALLYSITALLFTNSFLHLRRYVPRTHRIVQAAIGLLILLLLLSPLLPVQAAARVTIAMGGLMFLLMLWSGAILALRGDRNARFFMLACFFLILAGLVFILRAAGYLPTNPWTVRSPQIGGLLEMILLSLALGDRIRVLKTNLGSRLRELSHAQKNLTASESKYRHLVESTGDIVFSLDAQLRVLSVNQSLLRWLNLRPEAWLNQPLGDVLYNGPDRSIERLVLNEKLNLFRDKGTRTEFRAQFKTNSGEPREMTLTLERIKIADEIVNFGRASAVTDDILLRYLRRERQVYVIHNYLSLADVVGDRLTRGLTRHMSADDATYMRLALLEVLVNAIEHGNLGITYDEKSRALDDGNYPYFIAMRQADPRYRDRKVTIEYWLTPDRVMFRITDQGAGFDHRKMLNRDLEQPENQSELHGRGIAFARAFFDEIRYNERGNQVSLLKRLVS